MVLGLFRPPEPFPGPDGLTGERREAEITEDLTIHITPPAVLPSSLPDALLNLDGSPKKRLFIKTVLPLIYAANRSVAEQREKLLAISEKGIPSELDRAFLQKLAADHAMEEPDVKKLLQMVDTIPTSLALAQSILESGWGSGYLARRGNALFGQRVFGDESSGILPREVTADEGFRVRRYDDLLSGVEAYIRNLNRLPAYEDFRILRGMMRTRGENIDSLLLAGTLSLYSEEREEYVLKLQKLITDNNLAAFDELALHHGSQ